MASPKNKPGALQRFVAGLDPKVVAFLALALLSALGGIVGREYLHTRTEAKLQDSLREVKAELQSATETAKSLTVERDKAVRELTTMRAQVKNAKKSRIETRADGSKVEEYEEANESLTEMVSELTQRTHDLEVSLQTERQATIHALNQRDAARIEASFADSTIKRLKRGPWGVALGAGGNLLGTPDAAYLGVEWAVPLAGLEVQIEPRVEQGFNDYWRRYMLGVTLRP